jgi:hypothetical protein
MNPRGFSLPFSARADILVLDAEYRRTTWWAKDDHIESLVAPRVKRAGYLTSEDLSEIGKWKRPRRSALLKCNKPAFVEEVTRIALAPGTGEQLRIEVLTLLAGSVDQ